MEKIFALANQGVQLWTREWARKIRNQVEIILGELSGGDVPGIGARGVVIVVPITITTQPM